MNTSISWLGSGELLKVSGSLDMEAAGAVGAAFGRAIRERREAAIDLSQVDSCDTAGFQVLLAAKRYAESLGRTFRIVAPSSAVNETAAALGFSEEELSAAEKQGDGHAI